MPLKFKWFKHWKCWHARTNVLWSLDARWSSYDHYYQSFRSAPCYTQEHSKNLPAPTDPATHVECMCGEHGQNMGNMWAKFVNLITRWDLLMQQRYRRLLGDVDRQYHLFAFIVNFLTYHFVSIVELSGLSGWQCIHIVLLWLWDQKIVLSDKSCRQMQLVSWWNSARFENLLQVEWLWIFMCLLVQSKFLNVFMFSSSKTL